MKKACLNQFPPAKFSKTRGKARKNEKTRDLDIRLAVGDSGGSGSFPLALSFL